MTAPQLRAAWVSPRPSVSGSGLFAVHPGEVAFAHALATVAPDLEPGLHYARLPWPFEAHCSWHGRGPADRLRLSRRQGPAYPGTQPSRAGTVYERRAHRGRLCLFRKNGSRTSPFLLTGDRTSSMWPSPRVPGQGPRGVLYDVADADAVVRSVTLAALRSEPSPPCVDAVYTDEREEVEQRVGAESVQRLSTRTGSACTVVLPLDRRPCARRGPCRLPRRGERPTRTRPYIVNRRRPSPRKR